MMVCVLLLLMIAKCSATLSPVVIIPGDGSNQLEAKLNKPTTKHFYCSKKSDWYRIWLSASQLLPGEIDCWADNIRLVVDEQTGLAENSPGISFRVPDWGTTSGFEQLDPSIPLHGSAAFYYMVKALVEAGYERNVTLRGAPYDFRYTPDANDGAYGKALKTLIENTVEAQGGVPATIVTHSMGGLQGLYFLQSQDDVWKSKYIKRWIPISAPLIGAAKEFRLFATGDNEGLPVQTSSIRDEQRSYETNLWLSPRDQPSTVFARTDEKNYTTDNYEEFFNDIGYSKGEIVRKRVTALIPNVSAGPGVDVHCLYSTGVDTPFSFYYKDGDFSKTPVTTNSDGDGTVHASSLEFCNQWSNTAVTTFSGIDHSGMITDATVIKKVVEIILSD
eukprot:g2951.t1